MDANQPNATQEHPAREKAAPSDNGPGHRPRRRGSRRPRFGRGNHGSRGDRGGEQPHAVEGPKGPETGHHTSPSGIRKAIGQVEEIRGELEKALEDIQDALRTLEQLEREKTASEQEIETLRESLHRLHHGQGPARNPRNSTLKPASAPAQDSPDAGIDRDDD